MLNAIVFLIEVIVCIFLIMVIALMIGFSIAVVAMVIGVVKRKPNFGTRIFNYEDDEIREGVTL